MKKICPFLLFWIHNSLLVFLASILFPGDFVLGTYRHTILSAVILSGFVWTLIVWFVRPIQKRLKVQLEGRGKMYVYYYLLNFVALWIVTHLAPYLGFGVTRFTWLLGLSFIAEIIQATIWRIGGFSRK